MLSPKHKHYPNDPKSVAHRKELRRTAMARLEGRVIRGVKTSDFAEALFIAFGGPKKMAADLFEMFHNVATPPTVKARIATIMTQVLHEHTKTMGNSSDLKQIPTEDLKRLGRQLLYEDDEAELEPEPTHTALGARLPDLQDDDES